MAMPSPVDDHEILKRIARRDAVAMAMLFDRHSRLLLAVASRVLHSAEDAEEAVLDTFAQVWRQAESHDPSRGRVDTWLVMIARSRALDRLRVRDRAGRSASALADSGLVDSPHWAPAIDDGLLAAERRGEVQRALGALPAVQRRVLELAFYEGLTHEAIAAHDGEPLGTVKTRMRLGLSKLRAALSGGVDNALKRP